MRRPRGPELKMPDLKGLRAPALLADVYWDLRDRRLLPLVALVVVATAAVPFLLDGDAEQQPPAESPLAAELESTAKRSAGLTVIEAKPGLRDYRKRLRGRKPADPFAQRYTAPVLDGAKLNLKTESTTSTTTTSGDSTSITESTTTTETTEPGGSAGGAKGDGGSPEGGEEPELTLFAFAIDVRIVRHGGKAKASRVAEGDEAGAPAQAPGAAKSAAPAKSSAAPVIRRRVLPQTALPGKKAPVVTYMGPSRKQGRALLLVSTKVKSVFGDVACATGEEVCQLLEVEPGFPVTFVYGGNEVRYTFKVLKIEPVVIARD